MWHILLLASAFQITLNSQKSQCYSQTLSQGALYIAEVKLIQSGNLQPLFVRIYNSQKQVILDRVQIKQFFQSFTATQAGSHQLCVGNLQHRKFQVSIQIKTGVAARDFSEAPDTLELVKVEMNMERIEKTLQSIESQSENLRLREQDMRNTNQTINSRVLAYSACTFVMLAALAVI